MSEDKLRQENTVLRLSLDILDTKYFKLCNAYRCLKKKLYVLSKDDEEEHKAETIKYE
jgi:hypothetical protein